MTSPDRFTLKENEREARERLRAFWAGSSLGRPALHIRVARPDFTPDPWKGPELDLKGKDASPAWAAHCAAEDLLNATHAAEALPGTKCSFGSGLVVVGLLAGGEYDYESGSAWLKPLDGIWERPLPRFDPAHPVVGLLQRQIEAIARMVGRRGFVNPPILLDGLTTLSQFRTPAQLCLDCLECPEQVQRWSDALTSLYIECYEHFYQQVQKLGYGDTTSWLQAMAEGRLEAVQCDFAVMLSPEMFERFALPDLRRQTEYFDFSLYHLDGTCQMRFLDLLRSLKKLNGIQWNPEPPAGSPTNWIEAFREIRKRRFSLHLWVDSVDEAVLITRKLGPDGLLLVLPRLATAGEAEDAIKRIQQVC